MRLSSCEKYHVVKIKNFHVAKKMEKIDAAPGQKILEATHNLIYLPVTVDAISTLSVWLTDQHGKLLDLRGEELTIRFHLRER